MRCLSLPQKILVMGKGLGPGPLLRGGRRLAEPRPLDTLAELLAQAVRTQWRTAATEWVLV